ncbi:spermatogenesis- and oogenesis-specific basic helix-loop-helix-containing protein 1 [Carlito syrichta]|uniref:Spermatogenesis- and oogenesis-specific basic helix-loop-helix-containing protein 1 n=1 Tax=Carlito syrichta TaxID=1868482 RepID=A0A3Q0EHS1_CARSF|nr:spermatogenesis- and oogenesis-specific basic helix-loop-helix-containing protein 1 [Carlito syrichta]
MASLGPEPDAEAPRVSTSETCGASSLSGALFCCEDPSRDPAKTPPLAAGPSSFLPRNVLSERERRKRISASCEHLRALLPRFAGRREDMASVLEMAVQFLQLAHALLPDHVPHAVLLPSEDMWHSLQNILQWTLANQSPASVQWDSPSCETRSVVESKAPSGLSEVLGELPPLPALQGAPNGCIAPARLPSGSGSGPSNSAVPAVVLSALLLDETITFSLQCVCHLLLSILLHVPADSTGGRAGLGRPSSPVTSKEAPSCLGQAGSPAKGAMALRGPAQEALMSAPEARLLSESHGEEGTPILLTASADWLPGSLEGRGGRGLAKNSSLDRAEPDVPGDPEPDSQELQDGSPELWGADMGWLGLAVRDELDSIFPDFLAC